MFGRRTSSRAGRGAFSLIELLVVLAIVVVLMGLLAPALSGVRHAERSLTCLSNLRQIAMGFRLYADEHGGRLPASGGPPWEQTLAPYLGDRPLFRCPADQEVGPAVGSSYDWRDTGKPATTLAGVLLAKVQRSSLVLAFDALPSWHQRGQLNVVHTDGSARPMDQEECFRDLDTPLTP